MDRKRSCECFYSSFCSDSISEMGTTLKCLEALISAFRHLAATRSWSGPGHPRSKIVNRWWDNSGDKKQWINTWKYWYNTWCSTRGIVASVSSLWPYTNQPIVLCQVAFSLLHVDSGTIHNRSAFRLPFLSKYILYVMYSKWNHAPIRVR